MNVVSEDVKKGFGIVESHKGRCPHCKKSIVLSCDAYIESEEEFNKHHTEVTYS